VSSCRLALLEDSILQGNSEEVGPAKATLKAAANHNEPLDARDSVHMHSTGYAIRYHCSRADRVCSSATTVAAPLTALHSESVAPTSEKRSWLLYYIRRPASSENRVEAPHENITWSIFGVQAYNPHTE
jgi:hypothetical protein